VNGGIRLSKVLVAGDSAALRDALRMSLAAHCEQVLTARSLQEAENRIGGHCDIDLLLSDVAFPDGDGFRLLALVRSLEDPKPDVILMAQDASNQQADRAYQMGAIGYLSKPITLREVASILKQHRGEWSGARRPRRRSDGRACVLDRRSRSQITPQHATELFWYIHDVGESGAFLETESPIPVGTKLDLALDVGGTRIVVTAKVVRVQEPAWGAPGGVGVHFVDFDTDAQSHLVRYVGEEAS
jgi:two-component system chemotaxis response regulator CheY